MFHFLLLQRWCDYNQSSQTHCHPQNQGRRHPTIQGIHRGSSMSNSHSLWPDALISISTSLAALLSAMFWSFHRLVRCNFIVSYLYDEVNLSFECFPCHVSWPCLEASRKALGTAIRHAIRPCSRLFAEVASLNMLGSTCSATQTPSYLHLAVCPSACLAYPSLPYPRHHHTQLAQQ